MRGLPAQPHPARPEHAGHLRTGDPALTCWRLRPRPLLVVLTGYSSIVTAVEATRAGAANYLCKPATIEILAAFAGGPAAGAAAIPSDPISIERLEGNISRRYCRTTTATYPPPLEHWHAPPHTAAQVTKATGEAVTGIPGHQHRPMQRAAKRYRLVVMLQPAATVAISRRPTAAISIAPTGSKRPSRSLPAPITAGIDATKGFQVHIHIEASPW